MKRRSGCVKQIRQTLIPTSDIELESPSLGQLTLQAMSLGLHYLPTDASLRRFYMRHLVFRSFALLLMVGLLIFTPMPRAKAERCDTPCYQNCINQFRQCMLTSDNLTCCIEVNQCMEQCGTCRLCDWTLPCVPWESPRWDEKGCGLLTQELVYNFMRVYI